MTESGDHATKAARRGMGAAMLARDVASAFRDRRRILSTRPGAGYDWKHEEDRMETTATGTKPDRIPEMDALAERIERFTPHDGAFPLRFPGLSLYRISHATQELYHGVQNPGLCLVAQGAKRVLLEQELYEYDESRFLVYAVDVPVASRVVRATPDQPYLSLRLDLDPRRITELLAKVHPHGLPRTAEGRAISVAPVEPNLIEAVTRLIGLMATPDEVELLAPLVVDEILIRLLRGPLGARVAQIGQEDSRLQRVGKAVAWLREHYDQAVEVETLAEMVHMSASAFHQHFKGVTAMSPLQYQKVLRLQEARRLMLSALADAGMAARRVGYASASQFSREYGRHFGHPPVKDIARLRESMPVGQMAREA